jgi:hypothetical protein
LLVGSPQDDQANLLMVPSRGPSQLVGAFAGRQGRRPATSCLGPCTATGCLGPCAAAGCVGPRSSPPEPRLAAGEATPLEGRRSGGGNGGGGSVDHVDRPRALTQHTWTGRRDRHGPGAVHELRGLVEHPALLAIERTATPLRRDDVGMTTMRALDVNRHCCILRQLVCLLGSSTPSRGRRRPIHPSEGTARRRNLRTLRHPRIRLVATVPAFFLPDGDPSARPAPAQSHQTESIGIINGQRPGRAPEADKTRPRQGRG